MEAYKGYRFHNNKDNSINNISKSANSIDSNISYYSDSDEEIINAFEQRTESPMSLSSLEYNEEDKQFKAIQSSINISLDNIDTTLSPPSPPINEIVKKTLRKQRKKDGICVTNTTEFNYFRTPTPNMYSDLQQYFDK